MSKDSTNLVFRICSLQVYIKEGILGYIISIPLGNRNKFGIYKFIPMPVALDQEKFLFVEMEVYLWIDQDRQYYFMTYQEWLDKCKVLEQKSNVCKQSQPLLSMHLHENCAVKLM